MVDKVITPEEFVAKMKRYAEKRCPRPGIEDDGDCPEANEKADQTTESHLTAQENKQ